MEPRAGIRRYLRNGEGRPRPRLQLWAVESEQEDAASVVRAGPRSGSPIPRPSRLAGYDFRQERATDPQLLCVKPIAKRLRGTYSRKLLPIINKAASSARSLMRVDSSPNFPSWHTSSSTHAAHRLLFARCVEVPETCRLVFPLGGVLTKPSGSGDGAQVRLLAVTLYEPNHRSADAAIVHYKAIKHQRIRASTTWRCSRERPSDYPCQQLLDRAIGWPRQTGED